MNTIFLYVRLNQIRNFKRFAGNFKLIPVSKIKELDLIFIGSDQVWNPKITHGYDEAYFGCLDAMKNVPYVSYAVSAPASSLDDEKVIDKIRNFAKISVREKGMQEILRKYKILAEVTLDPTLLLPFEGWKTLLGSKKHKVEKKYIFAYNLTGSAILKEKANILAADLNCEIIDNSRFIYNSAGPIEFLRLVAGAKINLVSSFHGTVFSILLHKPFCFFPSGDERDERALSLLATLDLEKCVYSEDTFSLDSLDMINWGDVDVKLNSLRESSLEFINKCVNYEFDR